MERINMNSIPTRENRKAHFVIQNEKVRMEFDTDFYRIEHHFNGPAIAIYLVNKDAREILEPFSDQYFTIIELSETGEFYYPNLHFCHPEFSSAFSTQHDCHYKPMTSLLFDSSKVK